MSDYQTLLLDISDGVATLTLNRPDRCSAFDATMLEELPQAWARLRDDGEVRAVVLTGAGDAAFCTGIDRDVVPTTEGDYSFDPYTYQDPGEALGPKTHGMWKPVIAAVNGMACGGVLSAGRGGVSDRRRGRHLLRSPRHLRHGGGARTHAVGTPHALRRPDADDAVGCPRAALGGPRWRWGWSAK